jgi:hypothetical protein
MEMKLLQKPTAYDSNKWFKNGRTSLENEEYSGRLALSMNDKNVAEVCKTWVLCLTAKLYSIQGTVFVVNGARNNLILHHDDASCHNSLATQQLLGTTKFKPFPGQCILHFSLGRISCLSQDEILGSKLRHLAHTEESQHSVLQQS